MKHLFFRTCTAALALVVLAASQGKAELVDGLVAYWPFEGNLNDASPVGVNDGTYVGPNPETYAGGKFGQAIDLDGANGRNYVEVQDDPSTQVEVENGGDGNISISAWFAVESFTKSWQALIAKGEGSSWRIARGGDRNIMQYAGGADDIPENDSDGPNVNDGNFHHVVAITEGGVNTRLWVDGMLVTTGTNAPTLTVNAPANGTNIFIGDNPDTGDRSWDGRIDDVGLWNRILTEDEILALWNNGDGLSIAGGLGTPGDVNGDDVADIEDFNIISGNFGQSPAVRTDGDLNFNSEVDLGDFRNWKANRTAAVAAGGAIPEPATIALAVCGLAAGVAATRRRRSC